MRCTKRHLHVFNFGIFVVFFRVFLSHFPIVESTTLSGPVFFVIVREGTG
jgi:hypothetical protein